MSSDVLLPVKCRLEEGAFSETRLLLLHRLHLSELHCRLGWLFNLSGHYQLKYLDKFGDLITFSSEEEFQLALANYLQPEFRVLITPIEPLAAVLQWQAPPPPLPRPAKIRRAAFAVNGEHFSREPAERPLVQPESKAPPPPPPPQPPPPPPPSPPQHDGDWQAMFHPDYLKPRTATARRSRFVGGDDGDRSGAPRRVISTQRVQASLAGYPSDVATWASASASASESTSEYSERPRRSRRPQQQQQQQRQPKSPVGEGFVHYGIECHRCGADPLVGWRFKCSSCPNYNLCTRCFDSYSHGHGFYRLP